MDMVKDYGARTFSDAVMQEMLAPGVYASISKTRHEGKQLTEEAAEAVADAILKWAMAQGATHYIHWFQPLTDSAAGKAESFLSPTGDGRAIAALSAKAFVQGEPDASSFPSGGIRNTFEARGYTAWDPTSSAFVKDAILYIPTIFCGYNGEVLDHKTPLLRSIDVLSASAVKLLRELGDTKTLRVLPQVGAEQEYFIIDRSRYEQRLDLKLCGRTLIGAPPPKSQELDDHYYGRVRIRIAEFMRELDKELWLYGIAAKTKHNEVAPTQHEIACVYDTANITCDNNQLLMQVIREVAKRNNLAVLLHEKPFDGVNGSGKHNNYSLLTDRGVNLLDQGKTPAEKRRFALVLAAFVRAVDMHSDLLRLSTATPGNDCRLGGFEAPPAIISMFLGDELVRVLKHYGDDKPTACQNNIGTGVSAMADLLKDDMDRNRTSPFAFTGNKFEFRMLSSSQSIAFPNIVLNTILAESFEYFAQRLESAPDKDVELATIVRETYINHGRIIFNGNNYAKEWQEEARRRGLRILSDSLDSYSVMCERQNIELFGKYKIFNDRECSSRQEVLTQNYIKMQNIEARTLLEMVRRQIMPAITKYAGEVGRTFASLVKAGIENRVLREQLSQISDYIEALGDATESLQAGLLSSKEYHGSELAKYLRDHIRPNMRRVREVCDNAESIVGSEHWPVPTYTDLLHRV